MQIYWSADVLGVFAKVATSFHTLTVVFVDDDGCTFCDGREESNLYPLDTAIRGVSCSIEA